MASSGYAHTQSHLYLVKKIVYCTKCLTKEINQYECLLYFEGKKITRTMTFFRISLYKSKRATNSHVSTVK